MIKAILRPIYGAYIKNRNVNKFRRAISKYRDKLQLVIGASGIHEENWIPSEEYFLNLLDERDWQRFFTPDSIHAILAEHVWEHLTEADGRTAAKMCYKYLKPGGYIRIAVPDGYHPDKEYIDYVKPNGHGLGADDHKVLYNYKTFSDVFAAAGFKISLLEYFDEKGTFNFNEWDQQEGMVYRSLRYDSRNKNGQKKYTSIILDAIK